MIRQAASIQNVLDRRKMTYFSMEIGLIPEIKTYPGGLGVLAGDTIRSAADLNIPLIAITLISRMGNFRQKLTPEGRQIQYPDRWFPEGLPSPLDPVLEVQIRGLGCKGEKLAVQGARSFGWTCPGAFLVHQCRAQQQ